MIQLQILNKILVTGSVGIVQNNAITVDYFMGYEDEYNFIIDHYEKYGNVPDDETMLAEFNDFEFLEVNEGNSYLIDKISEEYLYNNLVGVAQKMVEYMKEDASEAVEYLRGELPRLQTTQNYGSVDIVSEADLRFTEYLDKRNNPTSWKMGTGFDELDDIIGGLNRGEELMVLFARTGMGKSWVSLFMGKSVWENGDRVGYMSPEMSPSRIGFRFDTLVENFSNRALIMGNTTETEDNLSYADYIKDLKTDEVPFHVSVPADFHRKVTVSKLRNYIMEKKLDLLIIDGIKYMTDERGRKGDNMTTRLTNVSEDLMQMSVELKVPIIVVVQSNREGVKGDGQDGTPELENIRDSDGIAHNATKVLSIRQTGDGLEIGVKKNRDGATGGHVVYAWDIDHGKFDFIPNEEEVEDFKSGKRSMETEEKTRRRGKPKSEGEVVF